MPLSPSIWDQFKTVQLLSDSWGQMDGIFYLTDCGSLTVSNNGLVNVSKCHGSQYISLCENISVLFSQRLSLFQLPFHCPVHTVR